jgi:hypothetical protein
MDTLKTEVSAADVLLAFGRLESKMDFVLEQSRTNNGRIDKLERNQNLVAGGGLTIGFLVSLALGIFGVLPN